MLTQNRDTIRLDGIGHQQRITCDTILTYTEVKKRQVTCFICVFEFLNCFKPLKLKSNSTVDRN